MGPGGVYVPFGAGRGVHRDGVRDDGGGAPVGDGGERSGVQAASGRAAAETQGAHHVTTRTRRARRRPEEDAMTSEESRSINKTIKVGYRARRDDRRLVERRRACFIRRHATVLPACSPRITLRFDATRPHQSSSRSATSARARTMSICPSRRFARRRPIFLARVQRLRRVAREAHLLHRAPRGVREYARAASSFCLAHRRPRIRFVSVRSRRFRPDEKMRASDANNASIDTDRPSSPRGGGGRLHRRLRRGRGAVHGRGGSRGVRRGGRVRHVASPRHR